MSNMNEKIVKDSALTKTLSDKFGDKKLMIGTAASAVTAAALFAVNAGKKVPNPVVKGLAYAATGITVVLGSCDIIIRTKNYLESKPDTDTPDLYEKKEEEEKEVNTNDHDFEDVIEKAKTEIEKHYDESYEKLHEKVEEIKEKYDLEEDTQYNEGEVSEYDLHEEYAEETEPVKDAAVEAANNPQPQEEAEG